MTMFVTYWIYWRVEYNTWHFRRYEHSKAVQNLVARMTIAICTLLRTLEWTFWLNCLHGDRTINECFGWFKLLLIFLFSVNECIFRQIFRLKSIKLKDSIWCFNFLMKAKVWISHFSNSSFRFILFE